MTKITRTINGKIISVEIEDEIANDILQTNDESFICKYIEIRYLEDKKNRAETRRHQSFELSIESGFEFADMSIVSEDDNCTKLLVEQALEKLTPAQRDVVRLVYFEGYSQVEVAEIKGVHKTAINKQLIRALSQLKKYLENI